MFTTQPLLDICILDSFSMKERIRQSYNLTIVTTFHKKSYLKRNLLCCRTCLEEAQPSCQNKMLAGEVSANYWFIHILHLSYVGYHADISKIRCIARRHYICITFLLEGGRDGDGVTGQEPLTVVQDCVSTIASVKPLDSLWGPLESFWPVRCSKNWIFLTGSWVIFSCVINETLGHLKLFMANKPGIRSQNMLFSKWFLCLCRQQAQRYHNIK